MTSFKYSKVFIKINLMWKIIQKKTDREFKYESNFKKFTIDCR